MTNYTKPAQQAFCVVFDIDGASITVHGYTALGELLGISADTARTYIARLGGEPLSKLAPSRANPKRKEYVTVTKQGGVRQGRPPADKPVIETLAAIRARVEAEQAASGVTNKAKIAGEWKRQQREAEAFYEARKSNAAEQSESE